jgi:hypothetical protein
LPRYESESSTERVLPEFPISDFHPETPFGGIKSEPLPESQPSIFEPEPEIVAPENGRPEPEPRRLESKTAVGKYNKPDLPSSMFRTTALSAGRLKPDLLPARFEPDQQQSATDEDSSALLVVSNGHYEPQAPMVDGGIAGCEHCRKSFTESGIYSCMRNHNICADCRHCGARISIFTFYISYKYL